MTTVKGYASCKILASNINKSVLRTIMAEEPLPPLILCMENASGEDVALRIESEDNFQSFLAKAKSLLGFEVDINSITRNQTVDLSDNIYQFLMNAEQNSPQNETTELNLEILEDNASGDFVYILDDGTQINASQIQFDDDEPPVDLTVENLPFVKYRDDVSDDYDVESDIVDEFAETKQYNIANSPVPRRAKNASPKRSFASTLPFKLLTNKAKSFEVQIKRYLESVPKARNVADADNKSPDVVVKNENHTPNAQEGIASNEASESFTREQVLDMFKDPPLATSFNETSAFFNEKRRHVRKSDPTRPVPKRLDNSQGLPFADVETSCNEQITSQNCFMCNKQAERFQEKLYLFDKEDQMLHRSSPPRKQSTLLKIICKQCLEVNFKPCVIKSPDKNLNADEYLVIKNNQQYVFQKNSETPSNYVDDAKAIIDKVETEILKEGAQDKGVDFVKVEIGSRGEIISKSIDNKACEEVVIIKEEVDDSSSDVQVVELGQDIYDSAMENLEEADEDVKEFLGKYQGHGATEMICRFCNKEFADLPEVIDHGSEHRHKVEDGELFPCPLCDYGYVNSKWLKAHLKAAHGKDVGDKENETPHNDEDVKREEEERTSDPSKPRSSASSPIATRTRSSINKKKDSGSDKDKSDNADDEFVKKEGVGGADDKKDEQNEETSNQGSAPQIKTEVKLEPVDVSDEEAIWIVQAAEDDSDVNEDQLKEMLSRVKAQETCHEATMFSIKDTHQCPTCKQLFISEETLKAHKCMKKRGRKRKCVNNDGLYLPTQDDSNKKHRKKKGREPSSDPQVVTCHDCSESFTSKVRLKFHMQFHEQSSLLTQDKQYQCSECGDRRLFSTETELFDHVHFQHPKQKRWHCPVKGCGKTFYLRATLTKHSRSHTDTRRYVCPSCGKRFLDKQTLDEHGVTHLQIKPFQCHICLKHLTRRSRLRMHLRAHEEELAPALVYVCHICSRAFKDNVDAQEHGTTSKECIELFASELKEEASPGTPRVKLSPTSGLITETQLNEDILEVAFRKATLKRLFEPSDQGESKIMLERVSDAARPLIRVVDIEKAFRCEYCEDVFYLDDGLNNHRRIHKGVKNPFTCHICKVTFATYSRCTTHKTTHGFYKRSLADVKKQTDSTGKREFPSAIGILGYGGFPVVKHFLCEDCGRSYLHWTYLQVHRRMKHPDQNLVYQCAQCHLTFPNSWSVSYHKKKVHSHSQSEAAGAKKTHEYWIPCRDCEEVLPNKNALYKHRSKEHSDMSLNENNNGEESQYRCNVCTNSYSSGSELAAHMRLHEPRRPHCCFVCGHSFRTVSMRNEHLRIHTGERPFSCDVCGVAFRRSSAMRNHRLTHTGVRAYPCPRCPRRYRLRGDLFAHVRAKHSNQLNVIEVPGLDPSPEEVLDQFKKHNIPAENIINITKISFRKGDSRVVPKSESELRSMMEENQEDCVQWRERVLAHIAPHRLPTSDHSLDVNGARINRGLAPMQRRPNILQRSSDVTQPPTAYPITLNITGEEISDVNVQLLLREGVLVNGSQMVQLQANPEILQECDGDATQPEQLPDQP